MRLIVLLLCLTARVLTSGAQPSTERPQPIRVPGQYLVQLTPGSSPSEMMNTFREKVNEGISVIRQIGNSQELYLVETANALEDRLPELRSLPSIAFAQPEARLERRMDPDDPEFDQQYYLRKIQAPKVWEYTAGGTTPNGDPIVIAVIDEGFDLDHAELIDNLWVNEGEIPENGIDDDGNGKVDDFHGWNLDANSDDLSEARHGTEVVGIISARGNNNFGGAGVAWESRLMLLSNFTRSTTNIVEGYMYIADMRQRYNASNGIEGAFVVATNSSFGIDFTFCDEFPIWGNWYDSLGKAGILNIVSTSNGDVDVDAQGDMPSSCPSEYMLAVTRTDEFDQKATGGYGVTSIDLAAPGVNIYSTRPDNLFENIGGGNSFSCPQVAGTVALLYGLGCETLYNEALAQPSQTALRIKRFLMDGTDPVSSLEGITVSGGRLNAFGAAQEVFRYCGGLNPDKPLLINLISPNPSPGPVQFSFSIPQEDTYEILIHNSLGQLLHQNTYTPGTFGIQPYQLDMTGWNSGTYTITIRNDRQTESAHFLKL